MTVSFAQSKPTVERPIPSETLRDCKDCTSERLELYLQLAEKKLQLEQKDVVIASKDTTITYQRIINADMLKNARKAEKRKWWSGLTWGAIGTLLLEIVIAGLLLL